MATQRSQKALPLAHLLEGIGFCLSARQQHHLKPELNFLPLRGVGKTVLLNRIRTVAEDEDFRALLVEALLIETKPSQSVLMSFNI